MMYPCNPSSLQMLQIASCKGNLTVLRR
jgi:hypothetical protein